ncbi:MAG: hypothetical protein GY863_03845 [bacterium]|nr:hypothetical protein [bacterium]
MSLYFRYLYTIIAGILLIFAGCTSENDQRIIFASSRSGNTEIYTMDSDGANLEKITDNNVEDISPSCSPDGKKFLYHTRSGENDTYEIMTGFFDTTHTHVQLTSDYYNEYNAEWSPDGKRICFSREINGNFDIWKMNDNGDEQIPVTAGPDQDTDPEWSPNGKKIVFISKNEDVSPGFPQVWIINIDGSNKAPLTYSDTIKEGPTWSSDGRYVYFTEHNNREPEKYYIRSVRISSGEESEVAVFNEQIFGPKLSDNNKFFLYFVGGYNINSEIYLFDIIAGKEIRLTNNSFADFTPGWIK